MDELILPHILDIHSALGTTSKSTLAELNFGSTSVAVSNLQSKIRGWSDRNCEINLNGCPLFLNLGGTAGKTFIHM